MNFLAPSIWWAAPIALAPIVLHLLFLRRARTVWFSDLTLLRRALLRTLPSSRLRQWLLLAIRCLTLLLLVGAFARPALKGGFASFAGEVAGAQGLRLVLLLDTSYSMSYRVAGSTRLELAKRAGREIVRSLRAEDRVAVAAFSDKPPEPAWAPSTEEALKALEAPPTFRPTDASGAIEAAFALLGSEPSARKAVLLLSDNAAHGFRGVPPARPDIEVLALGWDDAPRNAWVASVEWRERRGERWEVEATAGGKPSNARAKLWLASRLLGEAPMRGSALFELPELPSGWHAGRVELPEDGLAADDRFHFARQAVARPRILVLSASGDFFEAGRSGRFLRRMFSDPKGALLPYSVDFLDARRLEASELASYRAVLLAASKSLTPEAAGALRGFVRQGGGLFVVPEPDFEPEGVAGLEEVLPAAPGPAVTRREPGVRLVKPPDAARFRFEWKDFELERLEVARSFALRLQPGAEVWLAASDGRPLMAERSIGPGRTVFWASTLDPRWTNLALKPFFAAWLHVALGRLTQDPEPDRASQLVVGQPWVWQPRRAIEGELWIETPGKRRVQVYGRGDKVRFEAADQPGVYWFEHEGRREPFAVNLDLASGESDLSFVEPMPYATLDPHDPAGSLRAKLFGREVRWAFLYAILLLTGAELLLSKRPEA